MHLPEPSNDKSQHQPDTAAGAGNENGHNTVNNIGYHDRKKIVVVGLGMVALSFMCVTLIFVRGTLI